MFHLTLTPVGHRPPYFESQQTSSLILIDAMHTSEPGLPRQVGAVANQRCFKMAITRLNERAACLPAVQLLALAHKQNCKASLATEIDDYLRAVQLPDLGCLNTLFVPDPAVMPKISIIRAPLAGYGDLLGTEAAL